MEELRPIYGQQKSFYGKANIERTGKEIRLISYETHVATIYTDDRSPEIYGSYSNTTWRHVRAFLDRFGYETGSANFLRKTYGAERPAEEETDVLGFAGMFSAMAGLMAGPGLKAQNEARANIYFKTPGIIKPNNWDQLPEDVKKERLDKVQEVALSK